MQRDKEQCPTTTRETITKYIEHGIPPGSFVKAVLTNDLVNAILLADGENGRHLPDVVQYVMEVVPERARGSIAKYRSYLKLKSGGGVGVKPSVEDRWIVQLYEEYPRRVGKGQAVRAIAKALHDKELPIATAIDRFAFLLQQVRNFKQSIATRRTPKQYIPYPATWFNAKRYLDEPDLTPNSGETANWDEPEE